MPKRLCAFDPSLCSRVCQAGEAIHLHPSAYNLPAKPPYTQGSDRYTDLRAIAHLAQGSVGAAMATTKTAAFKHRTSMGIHSSTKPISKHLGSRQDFPPLKITAPKKNYGAKHVV